MLQIPIFHVNGEDPEAVAQVVRLSMDFRHDFHRDVVIDMYCYRRRGHNEQDEPAFTQPQMYAKIAARPPVGQSYLEHLLKLGEVTREEAERMNSLHRQQLESELEVAKSASTFTSGTCCMESGMATRAEASAKFPMSTLASRSNGCRDS